MFAIGQLCKLTLRRYVILGVIHKGRPHCGREGGSSQMRIKADKGRGFSVKVDIRTYTCLASDLRSEHRRFTAIRISNNVTDTS